MRQCFTLFVFIFLSFLYAAAQQPDSVDLGSRVVAQPLTSRAWLIRSVSRIGNFGDVESNALLVQGTNGSVLIDTPVTSEQTNVILDWAEKTLKAPVRHLIVTHWHEDRMGGIDAAVARRVATYGFKQTIEVARQRGLTPPGKALTGTDALELSGVSLEVYYPGAGHTSDNVVVWIAGEKVLFGGCLLKASASRTMGNLADANVAEWPASVARTAARYPEARIVIPGHGDPGGPELLEHTAQLLRNAVAQKSQ